jgi:hypothetical protein
MTVDQILMVLIGCNAGLLAMFIWHLFKCRDTRIDLATIKQAVQRIEHEIGDRERGIRGTMHEHAQHLTRHEMALELIRAKVDSR